MDVLESSGGHRLDTPKRESHALDRKDSARGRPARTLTGLGSCGSAALFSSTTAVGVFLSSAAISNATPTEMLPRSLVLTFALCIPAFCFSRDISFTAQQQLDLEHQYAAQNLEEIQFTPSETYNLPSTSARLLSRPTTVYRPRSLEILHRARLRSLQHAESDAEQPLWDPVVVQGPDVEDLHTLAQLARMAGNAYALPGHKNWYDVDQAWNRVRPARPERRCIVTLAPYL